MRRCGGWCLGASKRENPLWEKPQWDIPGILIFYLGKEKILKNAAGFLEHILLILGKNMDFGFLSGFMHGYICEAT